MNIEEHRRIVKVDIGGNEVELYIRNPTFKDKKEAKRVYNSVLSDALNCGAPLRAKLPDILRKQQLWDDDKDEQYEKLSGELLDAEEKIYKGGIKLSDARKLAIRIREIRAEMRMLLLPQASVVSLTAEAQAEDEEMNYLVAKCTVYNTNKKQFFSGYEDYSNRNNELAAIAVATRFAEIYRGLLDDEESLPEIQFLKKYKFVDENLRLVNKEGHFIDGDENLINEFGQKVKLDENGNDILIDDIGDPIETDINPMPFLDEEGNPFIDEKDGAAEKPEKVE
jgi:hypothetical protein